jgi:hypothetical protein
VQTTDNIFLVRPSNFMFNTETAASNAFQNKINESQEMINQKVWDEFDAFAEKLRSHGVHVTVFDDTSSPLKPDAIFPNNWISLHPDGTVILYPMHAPNRRHERRQDIIDSLKNNFKINKIIDLSKYEAENRFLEGTGSIVFDHDNKLAYACLSPRTDKDILAEVCEILNYKAVPFYSHNQAVKEIYHTNVMMCIAEKFAVICMDSISDPIEREFISKSLTKTNHEIIDISFEQMNHFAGNMLAIKTKDNQSILALSQSSFDSLTLEQKNAIEKYSELVPLSIKTIETIGGGSARCVIAEVFSELKA